MSLETFKLREWHDYFSMLEDYLGHKAHDRWDESGVKEIGQEVITMAPTRRGKKSCSRMTRRHRGSVKEDHQMC